MQHSVASDLDLHCLHISHKKYARLKWVKGFRWLRVYKETRGIPMLEIILHHEVMKKAISLKNSSSSVAQICFVYSIIHI